jgi:arylsulfatase A-like enzyme
VNYITIICDTLRRDFLGCYGNTWVDTRHIDRFAERSLVFDRAYSASFPTVPHRHDVMTGRYTFTYTPWAPLPPDETVLAQVLTDHGVTTMMICDCPHILEDGYHYDRGFEGFEWIRGQETDRWKTQPRRVTHRAPDEKIRAARTYVQYHRRNTADWRYEKDRFVARTMTTACEWLQDNYDKGDFYLYVDAFDPHEPWDAPKWYVDKYAPGYKGAVIDYPPYDFVERHMTQDELAHCRALYAAEVTLVDRWVGRLLQLIEDLGLLEDTMVLFTTDHGFLHGEHGLIGKSMIWEGGGYALVPLYEEINHIPWIISFPGRAAGRTNALVQPPDIMPTILSMHGIRIPETVQGVAFDAVLRGEAETHGEYGISCPHLPAPTAAATVVKDGWTAILYAKRMRDKTWTDRGVDGKEKTVERRMVECVDQLYDVQEDPQQRNDLARAHPDRLAEMRTLFLDTVKAYNAPADDIALWE